MLFRDLTYIFLAAVGGGLLAWRLHLPLILGFVLGGIAISPLTPGPHLADLHSIPTAIAVAAGLTQIGELSFVLAKAAWSAGMIIDRYFGAATRGKSYTEQLDVDGTESQ